MKSEPVKEALKPVNLTDFGKLTRITGRAFVAGSLPVKIAHKMADAAKDLFSKYNVPVDIQVNIDIFVNFGLIRFNWFYLNKRL